MFQKYILAIKSGDNAKLLAKIFPLDPTVLVALFIISKILYISDFMFMEAIKY